MIVIHFIGRQPDANGNPIYRLKINGTDYHYNWNTDELVQTGKIIDRLDLPGDILRAFHQAWDPDAYMKAIQTPPTDAAGISDDTENPSSPVYYPAKPEGEPVEILCGYRRSRHRHGVRNPH